MLGLYKQRKVLKLQIERNTHAVNPDCEKEDMRFIPRVQIGYLLDTDEVARVANY